MSMKGKTLLNGHRLLYEGKPYGYFASRGPGKGKCSCGEISSELESNAARQRWHKAHKQSIREHMGQESEVGQ